MSKENIAWSYTLIEAFSNLGVHYACIATGSRSSPLTIVIAEHEKIEGLIFNDERSAGFFAIGVSRSSQSPVLLICTSGTAAANFHPSIIESFYANHPIIVITADRPPLQRNSGSNQTMDQINLFGKYVNYFHDINLPNKNYTSSDLIAIQEVARKSIIMATSFPQGPVHLNIPFDKPLQPQSYSEISQITSRLSSSTQIVKPVELEGEDISVDLRELSNHLQSNNQGIIVCGPLYDHKAQELILRLSNQLDYPIFADPLSGLRFVDDFHGATLFSNYESFLTQFIHEIQDEDIIVIQLGSPPTSKYLLDFLQNDVLKLKKIIVSSTGRYKPIIGTSDISYEIELPFILDNLFQELNGLEYEGNPLIPILTALETKVQDQERLLLEEIQELTDIHVIKEIFDYVPNKSTIFASNSLPIRLIDQFVSHRLKRLDLYGNRGMSGIDGINSTALGIAHATKKPIILVVGDLSFYHDITGLLVAKRYEIPFIIVILNNQSGGIFNRLPINSYPKRIVDFFTSPHGLEFGQIAEFYGFDYRKIVHINEIQKLLASKNDTTVQIIVEVLVDANSTQQIYEKLTKFT